MDYDIDISGNGKGKMNYTIGFMDDDGDYTDMRKFKSIPVTKKTEISTKAELSKSTVLNVDTDGDGSIDERYRAGANGTGKIVNYTAMIISALSAAVCLMILITVIAVIKKRINRRRMR